MLAPIPSNQMLIPLRNQFHSLLSTGSFQDMIRVTKQLNRFHSQSTQKIQQNKTV